MAPVSPAQNYVSDYLKLLPESDLTQFQKILEMKVRPLDHNLILLHLHLYIKLQIFKLNR